MRILYVPFSLLLLLAAAVYAEEDAKPEAAVKEQETLSEIVKAENVKDAEVEVPQKGAAQQVEVSPTPQQAAPPAVSEETEGGLFVLRDMGWRDVFTDPRDSGRGDVGDGEGPLFKAGEEDIEQVWNNAIAELTVEVIIGWENDLAAIVAGDTVHSGNTIVSEKLQFMVQKITKDAVYFRCVSEEKEFSSLHGLVAKRRIIF